MRKNHIHLCFLPLDMVNVLTRQAPSSPFQSDEIQLKLWSLPGTSVKMMWFLLGVILELSPKMAHHSSVSS